MKRAPISASGICLLFASVSFSVSAMAAPQLKTPPLDPQLPVRATADDAFRWQQGNSDVWHLVGNCKIGQGTLTVHGREAVVWVERTPQDAKRPYKISVYFESDVVVDYRSQSGWNERTKRTRSGGSWFGRFQSFTGFRSSILRPVQRPRYLPDIYQRGLNAGGGNVAAVQQAQFASPEAIGTPAPAVTGENSIRRVLVQPRSSTPLQARSFTDPARNEQVSIIDWGVKVTIDSSQTQGVEDPGRVVILADRIVIWSATLDQVNVQRENVQSGDTPLEFYLEGNILFAQGDRVIYADRMYYNVNGKFGTILNAEVLTPVPEYDGLLRLKADVVQQLNEDTFQAYGAAVTSSRMGVPRYWVQSENIQFRDVQTPIADPFTGQVAINPQTGEPAVDHQLMATSRNNFVYLGGLPVFYWPTIATDLGKPSYYINRFSIKSDSVFGFQALTDWDAHQLLGIRNPVIFDDWNVTFDYLSDRGIALGTKLEAVGDDIYGLRGGYRGFVDAWGIRDTGFDNLGRDRRMLIPPEEYRGRVLHRFRQRSDIGFEISTQLGLSSDKNFLEQYYEREWDQEKDQTTSLLVKRLWNNHSFNLSASVRLNDFYTQTESLPRFEHFLLGQSLINDRLTWFSRAYVGYERLRVADPSTDPADPAVPLPWETTTAGVPYEKREGLLTGTRQEIDLPFTLGAMKFVPYALGDVMYMKQDRDASDVTRLYGQAGLRASLPFWRSNPNVRSTLFNVNGMAHKVSLEANAYFAESDQDLNRFSMYNSLDDDAQEAFRRRFTIPSGPFFGMPTTFLERYDERFFAFRSGMQGSVTAASPEIADDLIATKLGVRQRWQTKRGIPGRQRIVDFIVLDVEGTLYPKSERDNLGAYLGQVDYDFRWHMGDRLTMLSDGYFDFYGQGLRTASLGLLANRPEVGNFFIGMRSIEGPVSSNVLSGSLSYRMSAKWIATIGGSYDFGSTGNIGQTIAFTRIGESFLIKLGFNADVSRDNLGFVFAIEPRFLPGNRLGKVGGVQLPPPGTRGLE